MKNKLPPDNKFSIPPVTPQYVFNYFSCLDVKKSTGLDNISPKFLKLSADVVTPSLTKIINISIKSGIFPKIWKNSKIYPLHKGGSLRTTENYRPISILPILSKLIESHIYDWFYTFITSHNLLIDSQSGFRPKHSCFTALTRLTDTWHTAIHNAEIIGALMIDFKKAFDRIDHNILLQKISIYEFSSSGIKWMSPYLNNRFQRVSLENSLSEPLLVKSGVPQGSILGPLLFILYMNDLVLCIDDCNVETYADDTTIHYSSKNIAAIKNKLNKSLADCSNWCYGSKMIINAVKTKSMIIGSSQKLKTVKDKSLNLTVENTVIETVDNLKLLGLYIDKKLSWEHHINYICKTISQLLSILRKNKALLSQSSRILFYNGYISPHINYCLTIYGNCSN